MLLFNRSSESEYLLYDGWLHDPPFCGKGKGVQLFSGNNDFSATVNSAFYSIEMITGRMEILSVRVYM